METVFTLRSSNCVVDSSMIFPESLMKELGYKDGDQVILEFKPTVQKIILHKYRDSVIDDSRLNKSFSDVFRTRLVNQRYLKGISIRELSEISGVSASTISRCERGLSLPTNLTVSKLAIGLGIRIIDLSQ